MFTKTSTPKHNDIECRTSEPPLISLSNVARAEHDQSRSGAGSLDPSSESIDVLEANAVVVPEESRETSSRYKILRPHARGGLGRVYVARDNELHRRVALKEIQPEQATDPLSRRRFVFEAEVTGNLEHPGIVPVYGMGWREDGRPYYAMRFIEGEDLAAASRRFHASRVPDYFGRDFRWLLRRFVDVCNTVAYAHNRGVLHRDIKPSNIMLGPFGETLVMDWGVARPLAENGLDPGSANGAIPAGASILRTRRDGGSVTMTGQAVGTPAYMSPEQAAGQADLLTPASDVYSLGAMLYGLLTNRQAFSGDVEEVLQNVVHGRFERPRVVAPRVPVELEAICLKAMATDPSGRYASALLLAEDIEFWLADEPVTACRECRLARARRWVKRHQSFVVGGAAAILVAMGTLALAVPFLSMAWRRESEARRQETRQRVLALQKAAEANEQRLQAEESLRFLVAAFRKPDPAVDGRSLKVVDLLDRAVKEVESSLAGQPLTQATLYNAIGETLASLGLAREARSVYEQALAIRRHRLGPDHRETLESCQNLAMAYQDGGRLDQAIPILEDTLWRRRRTLGESHGDTIESMNDLAVAYWQDGRPADAIPLFLVVLPSITARLGPDHPDTLTIMDNLAVAYTGAGLPDRAIPLHEAVLAGFRSRLGEDHPDTLVALNNLARTERTRGRLDEAIRLLETTTARLGVTLGDDHPTTLTALQSLAEAYGSAGQIERARALVRTVLSRRRIRLGHDHADTLLSILTLGNLLQDERDYEQAAPLLHEFLERVDRIGARLPARLRDAIPETKRRLADSASGSRGGGREGSVNQGRRPR